MLWKKSRERSSLWELANELRFAQYNMEEYGIPRVMSDMNGINDWDRHANEESSVNSFKNRLDEYLADMPDMDS